MEPTFSSAGVALVRVSLGTRHTVAGPGNNSVLDDEKWRMRFAELAADEQLMDAVEHASPSLAEVAHKVLRGEPVKSKDLRRAALALTKYQLRRNGRPTPFGLFAGVTLAKIGAGAMRFGDDHRAVSRPDAGWLDTMIEPLRTDAAVLANAVVVANPVHAVRDGRLVLLERYEERGERRLDTSVRFTPLLGEVFRQAADPIPWSQLLERLQAGLPAEQHAAVESALRQLVAARFLITDVEPPAGCTDPLEHLLAGPRTTAHPLFDELREVRRGLAGTGGSALRKRMRALHDTENLVQTDVRLDLDLVLPEEVAREAERAAHTLSLLGLATGPRWLADYHLRFLERYGTERLVPVLELLYDDRGLGLPPEYLEPGSGQSEAEPLGQDQDRFLGELVMDHLRRGAEEVVLTDADLEKLSVPPKDRRQPASAELCAEIVSRSWHDLNSGDFRLVVAESFVSPSAGATVSRFAHLFPEDRETLEQLVGTAVSTEDGTVAAQVAFRPRAPRSANVTSVPQWLPLRIPLGSAPALPGDDVRLRDLAVCADFDRLHLVDTATGVRVRPVSCSMVNPRTGHVPPTARFLLELGEQTSPLSLPWQWGSWANAPHRPRIRHGRTVLASASWLPGRTLSDAVRDPAEWRRELAVWRERSGVPCQVSLTTMDNRIAVDLDDPLHVELFRQELRKNPRLHLQEVPEPSGWLRGPRGEHAAEVVFQLLRRTPVAQKPAQPVEAVRRETDLVHLPGGEWLYVKLYAQDDSVRRIVRGHLGPLLEQTRADVDGWHFVRYSDPDPHLRLRFHGEKQRLWSEVLPRLHDLAKRLRGAGLLNRVELATYEPEAERYGGANLITLAERVFHADSEVALSLTGSADDVAVLSVLTLLRRFGEVDEVIGWLEAAVPIEARREVPQRDRKALANKMNETFFPHDEIWENRDEAVQVYAAALSREDSSEARRQQIGMSLAHMHCNRLFGPNRAAEQEVYAWLWGGLRARAGRDRHGR